MGSDAEKKRKDLWDILQIGANSFAVIVVPILIAYYGHSINTTLKDREIKQKYVEMAIGILKSAPDKDNAGLREWAINIVNQYSGTPLNSKAIEELRRKPLRVIKSNPPLAGNELKGADGERLLTADGEALTSGGEKLTY